MLFPYNHTAICLVGCEYQHFGNLNMLRGICCIDGNIGDIITCQWLDAFVYISSTLVVTVETNIAEICFHKTRFQVCNTDSGISHVYSQTIGKSLDRSLCSTIDIASSIGSIASHRPNVDDVTTIAFNHARNNEACHCE